MKKVLSISLTILIISAIFAGCGKSSARILYNDKLSKSVKLADYKGIKVDTKSDDFKKLYDSEISADVSGNNLYVKKTEGTIADGDKVNIDYEGKKDGVAFEGGTAQGYDLTIGSNSFIEGFESGLIGKTIGSTVDLNLKFPDNYDSADLAGKAVVFTVKINYVTTTEERKPEDYYSELNFKSLEKYTADVKERAIKNHLLNVLTEKSEFKNYPQKDVETLYKSYKSMIEQNIKSQYGVGLTEYLQYANQTEADFKKSIVDEQIKPTMKQQMVLYSVLDKEKLSVTEKEITEKLNKTVKDYNNPNITADMIKDYYGDFYFEYLVVNEKALDFIYKNAKIS